MDEFFNPLIVTALSLGFIHTILGPDHYLPFVALSRSNDWSTHKTIGIVAICGVAHCLSSVLIGFVGIAVGIAVGQLESVESVRGDIASYLMIGFGLAYLIWAIKRFIKNKAHRHSHSHGSLFHSHTHSHGGSHVHVHGDKSHNLFWGIFIVFIFGPCEPLIPILMYPAATAGVMDVVVVAVVFTLVTVGTMLATVMLALRGLKFINLAKLQSYAHIMASATIILCGVLIIVGL